MMNVFLKIKHWQLFGLIIGIPFISQIVAIIILFVSNDPTMAFTVYPLLMILFMAIFFGWLYTLGVNLNKRLPDTVKMNLTLFKWFLFIPIVYIVFFCILMTGAIGNIFNSREPDLFLLIDNFAIIIPLHLFSMFCIFYCLYFNAKSLKAVEMQHSVTFNDYAGEFFLLWFFPIGIWFIQPRINKMFDKNIQDENNDKIANSVE